MNGPTYLLGVDPAFATMGWALVTIDAERGLVPVALGVVTTKASDKKRNVKQANDDQRRIRELYAELNRVRVTNKWGTIRAVCCEERQGSKHQRAAVALMAGAAIVACFAEEWDLPLVTASPRDVKLVTGLQGAVTKEQVKRAMRGRFSQLDPLLEAIKPLSLWEHAVDALAVVCACEASDVIRALRPPGSKGRLTELL